MDHPREVTDQLDFKCIIGGGPKRHLIDQRTRHVILLERLRLNRASDTGRASPVITYSERGWASRVKRCQVGPMRRRSGICTPERKTEHLIKLPLVAVSADAGVDIILGAKCVTDSAGPFRGRT
jgi:hypothetical protein